MSKKVAIVGPAKTGKTSLVSHLKGREYKTYIPTLGVEVCPYIAPSGQIYNIWDTAGDPRYEAFGRGYCIGSSIVIVLASHEEAARYISEAQEVAPNAEYYVLQPFSLQAPMLV